MQEDVLRLGERARAALRREALLAGAFVLALTATAGLVLARERRPSADPVTTGLIVGIGGVVALLLDLRRREALWRRFTVKVSSGVIESGPEGATRRLTRDDVRHAIRTRWPARGLVLVGRRGERSLFVPEQLERFDAVVAEVSHWGPIERSRVPDALARAWPLFAAGAVVLEAVALGSTNAPLVTLAAVVLAGVVAWSLANVLRSRRLALRGKALSLLLLVPAGWVLWRAASLWRL